MKPKPEHLSRRYGAQFEDATVAAAYGNRPPYPAETFDLILERLPDPSRARVLELGTGTGEIARPLAARVTRIDAVEPSAAMGSAAGRCAGSGRMAGPDRPERARRSALAGRAAGNHSALFDQSGLPPLRSDRGTHGPRAVRSQRQQVHLARAVQSDHRGLHRIDTRPERLFPRPHAGSGCRGLRCRGTRTASGASSGWRHQRAQPGTGELGKTTAATPMTSFPPL